MVRWLKAIAADRNADIRIELVYEEGDWVGAGEPLLYISGSFYHLVDLETLYLQKLGAACVAAYNAFTMCRDLPNVALPGDGRPPLRRHRDGRDDGLRRGGRLGARRGARPAPRASSATPPTPPRIISASARGLGTMPHALIGYAGSDGARRRDVHETFPDDNLTVLVDYFGREVTRQPRRVRGASPTSPPTGRLGVRLDTHGGRFIEGLDPPTSYAVLERHVPTAIRRYRTDTELR